MIKVITLPASQGKTTWVVNRVTNAGAGLKSQPRVVLPSQLQVMDFNTRLAKAGGVMGVKVSTIIDLANEILELGGIYPLILSENLQIKVLRAVLEGLDLTYYRAIKSKPGFVRSCLNIIRELKAGGITPDEFFSAAERSLVGPRLIELGLIYSAYQNLLRENGWEDRAGSIWMAAGILAERPDLCSGWDEIYLDGFDDLSPIQLQLINRLAERLEGFYLTLTGSLDEDRRGLAHKRFLRLRELLEKLKIEELYIEPYVGEHPAGPGTLLEDRLFRGKFQPLAEIPGEIRLAAVPDREAEVRAAFHWIRKKILAGGIQLDESAILVRNLEPYRGLITRIAGEYNIPVRIRGGLPLSENPLIAGILKLAKLISQGKDGLVWYEVLSIWRSPYLNWLVIHDQLQCEYNRASQIEDTKRLEEVARWGRVIQGFSQWEEAFLALTNIKTQEEGGDADRQQRDLGLPEGSQAELLWKKFSRFVDLLTPPEGLNSRENIVTWFETLLGGFDPDNPLPGGLGLVGEIQASQGFVFERDWQALAALARIFRDQVEAERLLNSLPVDFPRFCNELEEIINQSSYQPQEWEDKAVFCAGVAEARGLIFQAVAVLGMAEGEFPGTIKEDPFIRDVERALLQKDFNLPLNLSVDSAEGEYFYEALTRSTHNLLLTRPRIADNGAVWQASPYWEEVIRITGAVPDYSTTRTVIAPDQAATQAELLQSICARGIIPSIGDVEANEELLSHLNNLDRARSILQERISPDENAPRIYDGDLQNRRESIRMRYPEDHVWSASRLENYQSCPFSYFIGKVLKLEKPEIPEEGLNPRQLGNIYHRILEGLYQEVGADYSVEDLLAKLPRAADNVFCDAPREEGFRETSWWKHSQREILEKLELNLIILEQIEPEFRFFAAEQRFGMRMEEEPPFLVDVKDKGKYLLHGLIDRVDLNKRGEVRIVDYKTSGKEGFDARNVREGKKLQLPLYALAAQEGLKLGKVREGFYFHLLPAEPSNFKMSTYKDGSMRGTGAAMDRAAENGWMAVSSIKDGRFVPQPPDQGCPDYCPAVDFCWQYKPGKW